MLIARAGRGAALLATVPVTVPAIVMAVGFLRGWNAPWTADLPIYGTGAILVFSIAFRALAWSVLLRPPSVQTTSTYILQQFDQGSTGAGLAMAMTAALVSVATARRFAAADALEAR